MKNAQIARSSRGLHFRLLLGSIVIGSFGAWVLRQPVVIEAGGPWMWLFFLNACLIGGLALGRMDAWLPEASALPVEAPPGSPIWQQRGRIALAGAVILSGWVVARLWPDYTHWDGTVLPWLVSLGLVLLGSIWLGKGSKGQTPTETPAPRPDFPLPRWVEITGFLLIAALAVFLRVYRLDVFPPGIYVDETTASLDALRILEGNAVSPFATGWYETPNGYLYFMAGMFKLFGANWYTLKAISILPALLTVLAVYPLGRMMFGPAAGLAAMLFTAVSHWHLTMSRFGWNETAVPLFQVLSTYFLLRGLRERRLRDFTIGGLITGLMIYTYLSSRLALATIGLFLIYWIIADREGVRKSLKRHMPGLLMFGFAFLVAFAPLGVTYLTKPFTFTNRVSEISIFTDTERVGSLDPLWSNIDEHLRFFHQIGDDKGRLNLPKEPELDPVTGALFVIGLFYAAGHLRDRRRGLLWLWLLLGMAGGVFSAQIESPQSYRTLTALPAITLLAGDVISHLLRSSYRIFHRQPDGVEINRLRIVYKTSGIVSFTLLLLLAAILESNVFLIKQMNSPQVFASYDPAEFFAGKETVSALKNGRNIYLSPNFYSTSPMRFQVYGYMKKEFGINTLDDHPYRLVRPEDTLPIPFTGQDAVFVLDLAYQPVVDYFSIFYPHAKIETVTPEGFRPLYLRVTVPQSDLTAMQGLNFNARLPDGQTQSGESAGLALPGTVEGAEWVEWQGSMLLERSGIYKFGGSASLVLSLDGQPWTDDRFLCSGLHRVSLRWEAAAANELPELHWSINGERDAPIPEANWFKIDPPAQGLTGYYFDNPNWEGQPVCTRQTPFFMLAWPDQDPFAGAFSARFTGLLRVTEAGEYRLVVNADDGARITLDGVVVAEGLTPDKPNNLDFTLELAAGDHPIQIDYVQRGGGSALHFKWQPPGGQLGVVPTSALLPAP